MTWNYLSVHTAVAESQDLAKSFQDTPNSVKKSLDLSDKDHIEQIMWLGDRDYGVLIHTDEVQRIPQFEHFGSELPQGTGWTSQLLLHLKGERVVASESSDLGDEKLPFVSILFLKIKDIALLNLADWTNLATPSPGVQSARQCIEEAFTECIDLGVARLKSENPHFTLSWNLYYSYGGSDFAVVLRCDCAEASFAILSELHKLQCEELHRDMFQHCVNNSHTLIGLRICDEVSSVHELAAALRACCPRMKMDRTKARLLIRPRLGHASIVAEGLKKTNAAMDIEIGQNSLIFVEKISVKSCVETLAGILESDVASHINQTTTALSCPLFQDDIYNVATTPPPEDHSEDLESIHSDLSKRLELSPSTSHALILGARAVLQMSGDAGYGNHFSYLYIAFENLYDKLQALLIRRTDNLEEVARTKLIDVIDERIRDWLGEMDICFRSRYRLNGRDLDMSSPPVVAYQGSYQKSLLVSDLLANVFLSLLVSDHELTKCLRSVGSIQPADDAVLGGEIAGKPIIISSFGLSDAPLLKYSDDLDTCFLNIGWKMSFIPLSISNLAHEAANAYLAAYLKDLYKRASLFSWPDGNSRIESGHTFFMDAVADWMAVCLLSKSPDAFVIRAYFRRIAGLSDVFYVDHRVFPGSEMNKSNAAKRHLSEYSVHALTQFAWRFAFLSAMSDNDNSISPVEVLVDILQNTNPVAHIRKFLEAIERTELLDFINADELTRFASTIALSQKDVQYNILRESHAWSYIISSVRGVGERSRQNSIFQNSYVRSLLDTLNDLSGSDAESSEQAKDLMINAALAAQLVSPRIVPK